MHAAPGKFMGIPYVLGGESYQGADCITLLELFLRDCCGYAGERMAVNPDGSRRDIAWYVDSPELVYEELSRRCTPVPGQIQHGDILLFRPPASRLMLCPALDDQHFLFIYENAYSALGRRSTPNWARWFDSAYRLKDYPGGKA